MSARRIPMGGRASLMMFALVVLSVLGSGCGYQLVKKQELAAQAASAAADSARIVELQNQITTLQSARAADSLRYLQMLAAAVTPPPAPVSTTADSILKVREQELATTKDQLAKLTAEMERIKRRLGNRRS